MASKPSTARKTSEADQPEKNQQQAVAPRAEAGAPVPFLRDYTGPIGHEGIQNEDVAIPRLKIAQSMTDEVKDGKLVEGEIFINVSGESVWKPGDDPLPVHIVAQSKEYALWRPRKDPAGDGILARARPVRQNGVVRYKWDKPNTSFDVRTAQGRIAVTWSTKEFIDEDGLDQWGSEIPGNADSGCAATETHNYLLMIPSKGNFVVAAALARSAVKVARNLNALIKMGPPKIPVPLRRFLVTTVEETGGDNERYCNWHFTTGGTLIDDHGNLLDATSMDFAKSAMQVFQNYQTRSYVVDQSDNAERPAPKGGGADDQIPF